MSEGRVPTGVDGLDRVIEGGFPRKSLILVAGNPGTGKTVFSAQFLYRGVADYGENGVYVSFAENREAFYENMKSFGFDFERLERENRFRFLSMLAVKEEVVSSVLKIILEEISKINAKRLVIDSLSALTQAFMKPHDARIFIHMILGRIVQQAGCTTVMVVEVPFGEERIGLGIEEFIADGVIHLRVERLEERLFRDISILKMRGTEVREYEIGFTIKDGFEAFTSFEPRPIERKERFRPLPDLPEKFSTGSRELDDLLDGGYPKGSTVLLEIGRNVSILQYYLILLPTYWNFLAKGAGVIVIPSSGVDHNIVWKRSLESGLSKDSLNRQLRICSFKSPATKEGPYMFEIEGRSIDEDYQRCLDIVAELQKETRRPLLCIVGVDRLLANYGTNDTVKVLNSSATLTRESGGLLFLVLKPGYPRVSEILNAFAEIHLKMIQKHGALLLYGLKPRIRLHFVEMETTKGYPLPRLIPIL